MKSRQVIQALEEFKSHELTRKVLHGNPFKIMIRTDNGPQFISQELLSGINLLDLQKENIRKGTPQQNGHIESFHSTLQKLVCSQHEFESEPHAQSILSQFYYVYNHVRIMKEILYQSPQKNHLLLFFFGPGTIDFLHEHNSSDLIATFSPVS